MTSHSRLLLQVIFAALAISTAVDAQSNAKPKPTGSIGGRVTVSGKAAPDIEVVAVISNSPQRPAARTTTDNEGRYRLNGLSAGNYHVMPIAPTLVAAVDNSDYRIYYGASKPIMLNEAESVDDIDLKLVRGGVITGRITDAEGRSVVEQEIRLSFVDESGKQTASGPPNAMNYLMYRTDDRGIYRLYGLPPGFYKVSVGSDSMYPPGGSPQGNFYVRTFYPDTTDTAKAKVIELTEGSEATKIDIKLGQRSETFSVTGRVVDSVTGKPLAGMRPTYSLQTAQDGSYSVGGPPTDTRGEFRLVGLPPGHYQLFASSRMEGSGYYCEPIAVDLVDSDVTGIELKAIQGLTISGVVMPDAQTNSNVISKFPRFRIMASVRAEAQPQLYGNGLSPIAADGTFQISGLSPGRVGLYIAPLQPTLGGMMSLPISRIEQNGMDVTKTLELQPGQSLSDLRVFVMAGTGAVRGTVKFANGTMPSEAHMYVSLRRDGGQSFSGSNTEIDARGNFRITNLPAGTYEVIVVFGAVSPRVGQPLSRPRQPLKQTVNVTDDTETEVQFTIDMSTEVRP